MEKTTVENIGDRIKLPFSFDAEKMQEEIKSLSINDFIYYNVVTLRGPAFMIDPSIPPPPPSGDYADGSWTEWADSSELKKSPYLNSIVDQFKQHTKVTLVRLLRLEAGAEVKEHTDPTLGLHIEKSVIRLTIPIFTNEKVKFFLNNSVVPMKKGECWYLRLTDPHRIINEGETERINMSIDMIPNNWLRDLVQKSMV